MACTRLHLFITILAISLLISTSDHTTSEARTLLHETQAVTSTEDTFQKLQIVEVEEMWETRLMENVHESSHGRMEYEINRDYPGSGANNRHTPNPPSKD